MHVSSTCLKCTSVTANFICLNVRYVQDNKELTPDHHRQAYITNNSVSLKRAATAKQESAS